MTVKKMMAIALMGLAVSGCASVETATRNAPLAAVDIAPVELTYNVQDIRVSVPKSLKVSEANRYYPGGDIVWREDPLGDRHAQVKAIVENALRKGVETMKPGLVPVILDVEVTRFHALSEKTRYTIGGVHAIQFNMVLRNPETGVALGEPHFVKADFKGLGGQAAIAAEARGVTQKYRITQRLAQVIQAELSGEGGYQATNLGLIGALNQL
ncbi:DUF6778 family protein [Roseovarius aestuariivivens]|uniref:DUF6778 family protein n=1 Tax=Roseovarius aestuariivivens TaxID=1888910 RepID=UPI001081DA74|nr:DUF6778 family protein [Roseovarius aestuariivivens]